MESPASTSPPSVFRRISNPSISLLSSTSASKGSKCSYLVALVFPDTASWPSISPTIVSNLIRWLSLLFSRLALPVSFSSSVGSALFSFSFFSSLIKNTSILLFIHPSCDIHPERHRHHPAYPEFSEYWRYLLRLSVLHMSEESLLLQQMP